MKVLYFKPSNSTFVLVDEQILKNNFITRSYFIKIKKGIGYIFPLLKLLTFLIFVSWRYDVFYTRFSDWHTSLIAFFKRLYHKKLFIVVGGNDVAAIEQISYGVHLSKIRSKFSKYALNNATCLLPNTQSLVYYENRFVADEVVYGGIRYFAPNTNAKIKVIHNGYDPEFWKPIPNSEKKDIALTVAIIKNEKTFKLKGIDKFIQTAEKLPDFKFQIVGISKSFVRENSIHIPQNLEMIEIVSSEELIELFSHAKVFCLFSLSEGMPNVLSEAMLCECIPVGSNVTSIPEIIGDTGFVNQSQSIEEYIANVKKAFVAPPNTAYKCRERIKENYCLSKREQQVTSLIKEYFE